MTMNRRVFLGRSAATLVAVPFASSLLMGANGCNVQQTIADLIVTLGTAVVSLETMEGNTSLAAQIQKDYQIAETAVLNWKNGSPATLAIEALNVLQSTLSLLPISPVDQELISLALGTVEAIITELSGGVAQTSLNPKVRVVRLSNPPKNSAAFKKQWNAIASDNPTLKAFVLK